MKKENLVKRIKQSIKNKGLTQKEFCAKANINYDLFTQYLPSKTRKIPNEWIIETSKHTGVSTDFLFGLVDNTKNKKSEQELKGVQL